MAEKPLEMSKKAWSRWSEDSQEMFVNMYDYILPNQTIFSHPNMIPMPEAEWKTIAWNTAYMAADFIRMKEKNGKKGKK